MNKKFSVAIGFESRGLLEIAEKTYTVSKFYSNIVRNFINYFLPFILVSSLKTLSRFFFIFIWFFDKYKSIILGLID